MKHKALITLFVLAAGVTKLAAQQSYPVTEATPVTINGLTMGYHINSEEVKQVSDKGDFSRFSIKFFVTNNTPEAKIIFRRMGFVGFGDISPNIVQFNCANATGARLTSKSALLSANPAKIMALVEDKDPNSNKTIVNKRLVDVGFWVKPGETINTTAIMIVPLNTKPDISAVYLMSNNGILASAPYSEVNDMPPPPPMGANNIRGTYNLHNNWKDMYINTQNGTANCSITDLNQAYAQWQIIPLPGRRYLIKNRWQNTFLTSSKPGPVELSASNQYAGAMWEIEPVPNSTFIRFKNVGNNTYLNIEYGSLQSTPIWDDALSARWALEGR